MEVNGRISYSSQEPWLFPATIKQNITFEEIFDRNRYKEVIRVSSLEKDLDAFPTRDETVVSDNGQNLSRGQQCRVNLARALYRNSDVYILDDPFSSLDGNVSNFIFSNCIRGFLRGKLVILTTHKKEFLKEAKGIVVMDCGKIKEVIGPDMVDSLNFDEDYVQSTGEKLNETFEEISNEDVDLETTKLLEKETRGVYYEEKREGGVDFAAVKEYFSAAGGIKSLSVLLGLYFITQLLTSWFDYYLSEWLVFV